MIRTDDDALRYAQEIVRKGATSRRDDLYEALWSVTRAAAKWKAEAEAAAPMMMVIRQVAENIADDKISALKDGE